MPDPALTPADIDRLTDALRHEEEAVKRYRQYAREADDDRVKEMFDQFGMNESWHAAAIRNKLRKARP